MRDIGILGGSFDPFHNGHLAIAEAAMAECELDEILLIPARVQPFKLGREMAGAEDRVNMVTLVAEADPRFSVSTIEAYSDEVSYTYNTLTRLRECYPGDKLSFILGTDAALSLEEWYRSEDLLRESSFIVAIRPGDPEDQVRKTIEQLRETYNADIRVLHNRPMRISSTEIKARVREGKEIRGWVPDPVERYIIEHRLYQAVH